MNLFSSTGYCQLPQLAHLEEFALHCLLIMFYHNFHLQIFALQRPLFWPCGLERSQRMSTSHLCPHIQGRHLVLWVCHGGIADGKSTLGKAGTNLLKCQFLKQSSRGDSLTWFSNAWHIVNVSCNDQKQNSWNILKYIYILKRFV